MQDQGLKTKHILSSELTQLSGATRDIINYGKWFLYEVSYPRNEEVKYLLSTSEQDLLLAFDGTIISVCPKNSNITYKSIINFSDIPKPKKINLNNYVLSV